MFWKKYRSDGVSGENCVVEFVFCCDLFFV